MAVTAAQAIANHNANPATAPQAIADTAANLLAAIAGLVGLKAVGGISGVQLTGTANTVTASNAAILAQLPGFALATGATLAISDTSAHLLDPANAAGYPFATRIVLAGTGTVSAADAAALAALHNFRPGGGTTLQVADTAANLLLAANATGLAKALTVTLNTSATVTALQMHSLSRLRGFRLGTGVTLVAADSADQLLLPSVGPGLARATSVSVTGDNVENAARAARLGKIARLSLAPGATLTVRDSAPNLLTANGTAAMALATAVVMTGANYVSAAQADMFAALPHFSLAASAQFLVSDTAAQLLSAGNAAGMALATNVRLIGSNTLSVADTLKVGALPRFHLGVTLPGTLIVSDSASAVNAALESAQTVSLPAMAALNQITKIELTDAGSPAITLTATQYTADTAALGLIANPIKLTVVAAPGDTVAALSSGITLDGSAGGAELSAVAGGGDTLIGGADDTLNGGAGGDAFIFGTNWGAETVTGFAASDIMQFSTSSFADWAHLLGASAQVGSDVVITLDDTDTITLKNVTLSSLTSSNARFV